MSRQDSLIILSSGGTGGHVFPAQALAETLLARGYRLAFVTDRRGDAYSGPLQTIDTYAIHAAGVSGRGPIAKVAALGRLAAGYLQARRLLRELAPDVVVGFGGYATIPTLLAASHLGIKTAIHEQNAVLGRANRVLAPRATRVATAFKTTSFLRDADRAKAVWTGNPVRPEIVDVRDAGFPALGTDSAIRLLITGGSQGASIFSTVVPAALSRLPDALRGRLHITQQCRKEDLEQVRKTYAEAGIDAELSSFFDDIPQRLAAAHMLICRAGASTIAELTTAGRPAILVPYPHAIDDHQTANAARLCDSGGAWLMPDADFTAETLSVRLASLFSMDTTLMMAARCATQIGMPEATERLADVVAGVLSTNGNGQDAPDPLREAAA
ncbi:MAG: undecaprenyldiphospho-muramoylpentapeptide beta-N-acetylglucosaminyltransferase [Alphaproteobacteria bacterium]|nr:undecaprenyldiphospho-muramoylpentapeptide beta-N-acetylglucosaminyltransferase [Alphaproteobacteria bacterium]